MSYSTTWTDDRPPGSEAAKNIDNEIRLLRAQISERMTGTLVEDWAADPIVPLAAGGGLNRTIVIPHVAFVPNPVSDSAIYTNAYATVASGTFLNAPVILPQGSIIKGITYIASKNDCTSINCNLTKYIFTPALTVTFPVAITQSGAGFLATDTALLDLEVDGFSAYYVWFSSVGGTEYFVSGARILYSAP